MAHLISIQNGNAELAYSGETPWHGLGTKVDGLKTAQEMIVLAGLNWTVGVRPVFFERSDALVTTMEKVEIPGYRAIVRDDNQLVLGVASSKYRPIQNVEAADIADAVVLEGGALAEVCGALDDGRRCWILTHIPADFEVVKGDLVKTYFLLAWGHDGKHGVAGKLTPIRVVCNNTLTAAGFGGKGVKWSQSADIYIRHTGDVHLNIEAAQKALGLAKKQVAATAQAYIALADTKLDVIRVYDYLESVFPSPEIGTAGTDADNYDERLERWNARQREIIALYEGGQGHELARGTAWGAYNAVTEYIDHVHVVTKTGKVSRGRQQSALFGAGADVKAEALTKALALVGK